VRDKGQIFGMTKFSIHDPIQRGYQNEAIAADMMRLFGILSPRYFFVDVRINDQTIGIMALEEHFTKELLESQSRRNGPILAIEDDLYWQQYFLNGNRLEITQLKCTGVIDYCWILFIASRLFVQSVYCEIRSTDESQVA